MCFVVYGSGIGELKKVFDSGENVELTTCQKVDVYVDNLDMMSHWHSAINCTERNACHLQAGKL